MILTLIIMIIGHWMSKDDTSNSSSKNGDFGNARISTISSGNSDDNGVEILSMM